jgi:hypothetical protein
VFTLSHPWRFVGGYLGLRTYTFPKGLFRFNISPAII